MVTAEGVLKRAASWIGWREDPNSEWTPFGAEWGYPYGEWCGMFCQSMVKAEGGTVANNSSATMPHTHYTVTGVQAFKRLGWWFDTPKNGDLIYIRWGNYGDPVHHVGWVEDDSTWKSHGYVTTIEGNIDEAVGRFRRWNNGIIVGFGRPQYTKAEQPVLPEVFTIDPMYVPVYESVNGQVSLGLPTTKRQPFFGNAQHYAQAFTGGLIIENGGVPYAVYGGIYQTWAGGEAVRVGLPTSSEIGVEGLSEARMNLFSFGGIVWTPQHGAYALNGPIWEHWLRLTPEQKSVLGAPTTTTFITQPDLPGRAARFENGWLVYSAQYGVHPVIGDVLPVYENRGTLGLGYPLGPATVVNGRTVQRFTNGELWLP